MHDKNLTVIIPVYNSENYISRCLDCLVNQTLPGMVILVIDDASTDNTSRIVNDYRNRYDNIVFYRNTKNKGPAFCRNRMLNLVKTEYVAFLDGDDWLDVDTYEHAISSFTKGIDIVMWEITTVWNRSKYESRYSYNMNSTMSSSMSLRLYSREMVYSNFISPLLGNKVFRVELLNRNAIRFNSHFFDDDIFVFKSLVHSKSIRVIKDVHLYYYQHAGSFSRQFSTSVIYAFYQDFSTLKAYLKEQDCWVDTVQYYYAYYEKCLINLKKQCSNMRSTADSWKALYEALLDGFYKNTDIAEYVNYCDMDLFPL